MKIFLLTILILTSWKFANCQDDNEKLIYTNARLPTNVNPIEYDVNITTYLPGYDWKADDRNMSYEGTVTVRLEVVETTKMIVMHSDIKTQTINAITVTSKNNAILKLVSMVPSFEDQFLNMKLNEEVYPGDELEITISFIVFLRQDNRGYYITKSIKPDGVTMLNAVTQFEAVDARLMLPCFDEPEFKATWKVTLKYPTGAVALTNTIEEDSFEDGDFTVTTFKRTVRMSSYLLAIFIGDVKYKETISDKGTRIRVYADPKNIDSVDMALNHSRIVLEGFEKLFGIDFPLEKLDFVSVFDFAFGAMENWGLIVHKANTLLGNTPIVSEVVIHELAHQWFGNLVTMKYWNETWLNEGFATYMTPYGESFISSDFDGEDFYFMNQDGGKLKGSEGPLSSIVQSEDGTVGLSPISYSKGSSFIRMLEKIVGVENFHRAIRNYLFEKQYSNVEGKDLYAALEAVREPEENSVSIESFARCWTHQNAYPTVFVKQSDNGVVLTQRREVHVESDYKVFDECGYKWDIPIWYQRAGEENVEFVWFKKEDYELELKVDGAVVINANSNGLYDVVYTDELYELIAKDLESNKKMYSSNTKLRLLKDAFDYAIQNQISVHNVVVLAQQLLDDESDHVRIISEIMKYSAMEMLSSLNDRINDDIQMLTNSTATSHDSDFPSMCDPSLSIPDCVKLILNSELEACALMKISGSDANAITNLLFRWMEIKKDVESLQKILRLFSCREEEMIKRWPEILEDLNDTNVPDSQSMEELEQCLLKRCGNPITRRD